MLDIFFKNITRYKMCVCVDMFFSISIDVGSVVGLISMGVGFVIQQNQIYCTNEASFEKEKLGE